MGTVTSSFAALLTAVSLNPIEPATEERVDLMEVNHFYDEHGKLVFDQVIFYDWCEKQCRFNVRAWRLLKKPTQVPRRNWSSGDYVAVWQDGEQLRKVRAATMRESWTQYDPELVERQFLPKDQRRELQKLVVGKPRQRRRPIQRPVENSEPVRTAETPRSDRPTTQNR